MERLTVKSMNIDIELNGLITNIIGPTNSGKTYLLKKMVNIVPNKDIFIDDKNIKDYDVKYLQNNIAVCLNDEVFHTPTVVDELSFFLNKLGYNSKDIQTKVNKLMETFSLTDYQKKELNQLPLNIRMLVKILSYVIIEPLVLGIDNCMIYLDTVDKENIIKYIKKKKIALLNVISDLDDVIYGDRVLIMNHFKGILYGDNKIIVEDNSILPYMGIRLPFVVDLSQNLAMFNKIDKIYLDKGKLVNKLWK
jgi:energy-coupling factor transporter ATP-binding protein EcfA2